MISYRGVSVIHDIVCSSKNRKNLGYNEPFEYGLAVHCREDATGGIPVPEGDIGSQMFRVISRRDVLLEEDVELGSKDCL
jgi:hypothetical protein